MTDTSRSTNLRWLHRAAWAGATALALVAGTVIVWRAYAPQGPHAVVVTGEAEVRSDFALTDHTGRPVTEADFVGRWQFVFFGYTTCPDVCPTTLAFMASVLDLLGDRADRVAPLFITVDPARDTVPVMAEYVAAFHPRLVGLTGTEAQIAEAARNFRVFYEKMDEPSAPDGYLMAHAGYIYLMNPDGRFEAVFREERQPPEEMVQEIVMRIEKEEE